MHQKYIFSKVFISRILLKGFILMDYYYYLVFLYASHANVQHEIITTVAIFFCH